jgi:phospholipid/cholesterol/gamma-HCH transport system substrate-binding protein
VALAEGPGDGTPLHPDGLIPLGQTTPALDLTVLFNGFKPLFTALTPRDVNELSLNLVQVLQGEGGTVEELLAKTASLTNTLADRDQVIGRVITNLNSVLSTLDDRDAELDQSIVMLQRYVSGLAADRQAIGAALANLGTLTMATSDLLGDARPSIAADLSALDTLAGTLNDNSAVLDKTLNELPGRFAGLTRTASYGSWFNFYLCDFSGKVGPVTAPPISSTAARCTKAGAQ